MRRALLAVAVLAAGCSLESAGTAGSVDAIDSGVDVTIEGDTGTPVVEDSALDTFIADASVADTGIASVDTGPEVPDAGKCPAPKGDAKPCDGITHREELATGQMMDGAPDDFCDVPYVDFDNSKGVIKSPSPTPGAAVTTMRIRVAWSSYGIHAHLAVQDPNLLPLKPLTDKNVFLGDSVEVYIAGHTALTGDFDGLSKDIGAQQIIFTAPDSTTMSRAVYFYNGVSRSSPDINRWTARLTSAGYDVELRLPWSELKPPSLPAPTMGARIALSWAFNNKYNTTDPQAFSVFEVKTPYPSPTNCTGDPQPFCDDRLWCTPKLL